MAKRCFVLNFILSNFILKYSTQFFELQRVHPSTRQSLQVKKAKVRFSDITMFGNRILLPKLQWSVPYQCSDPKLLQCSVTKVMRADDGLSSSELCILKFHFNSVKIKRRYPLVSIGWCPGIYWFTHRIASSKLSDKITDQVCFWKMFGRETSASDVVYSLM